MTQGGPAFPANSSQTGMSLRDWFAGQAIAHIAGIRPAAVAAQMAYELADAMLEARKKP